MGSIAKSKRTRPAGRPTKPQRFWQCHARLCRWLLGLAISAAVLVAAVWVAFQVSPWPGALLIRHAFEDNDTKVAQALQKYVPPGITQLHDRQYRPGDPDAYLDVFYQSSSTVPQPTVVWVHGGAWVAGNKNDIDNYMAILASHGFTAISVNYSLAPEQQYPVPIVQLNAALAYIQQHAQQLHSDGHRIVLAGDSAGSQIAAQMADIITNPAYAADIGISPALPADRLKGLLLNCGAYDLALPDYSGQFGSFLHTVLWAYSGTADFLHDPRIRTASVANYLTKNFPPSFITAGNADPLEGQSTELAARLQALDVPTSTLFYPAGHQPALQHEYQFDLDLSDARHALAQMVAFLQQYDH